jgi:uncharacterized membrane protein YcaP (DUF421 family)
MDMLEETYISVVRTVITFFTLLIYTRLLGKQQIGNLTYFDYINGITIGSLGGTLATDLSSKAWVHWVGLTVFISLTFLLQITTLKNRYLAKVIDGEPTIVIENGKMLEQNLNKMRIKRDDLMMMLRQKHIFDLTKVAYAIFEPNGGLSVLAKAEHQTVTPKDLNLVVTPAGITTELIMDGILLKENLAQRKKDLLWLQLQLQANGISDMKEVSFAAILPNDQLYVDKFEDHITKQSDISDYDGPY